MIQEDYHSQNPYHNAVHAADVTQAMHCYLKEPKVRCWHLQSAKAPRQFSWFNFRRLLKLVILLFSHSVMSTSLWPYELWPTRLLCPWYSSGKNSGVGCHFLLQGIFPIQGSNPRLLHWQADLFLNQWATWEAVSWWFNQTQKLPSQEWDVAWSSFQMWLYF